MTSRPGDLPMEQPAKFVGRTFPPPLLARADEVVQ